LGKGALPNLPQNLKVLKVTNNLKSAASEGEGIRGVDSLFDRSIKKRQ